MRFVFATNRDLEAEVARGAFRQDLYYRVNGVQLQIPPLRERSSEIVPLAELFAHQRAEKEGRPAPTFTPEAIAALRAYSWPGNIRELKNRVETAVLMAGDAPLSPSHLSLSKLAPAGLATPDGGKLNLKDERQAAEKRAVLEALEKTNQNQTKAAELLGISRRTLVSRLQEYGMTKPRKK